MGRRPRKDVAAHSQLTLAMRPKHTPSQPHIASDVPEKAQDSRIQAGAESDEEDLSSDEEGNGSDNRRDIEIQSHCTGHTVTRTKGLNVPPSTEQSRALLLIQKNWCGGAPKSVQQILGDEFFEGEPNRKVLLKLASLSVRLRGRVVYARVALRNALRQRKKTSKVLTTKTMNKVHLLLDAEEDRAEDEEWEAEVKAKEKAREEAQRLWEREEMNNMTSKLKRLQLKKQRRKERERALRAKGA